MAAITLYLLMLSLVVFAIASPVPGRIPKVYNALITSNQNLEPSKAFPVYQPVLQESAFGFPYQPTVFYGGDYPGYFAVPPGIPRGPSEPSAPQPPKENVPDSSENNSSTPKEPLDDTSSSSPQPTEDNKETSSPPSPPSTQSPIPLNEFGLPPAVLPLGRFEPAHDGYSQFSPPFYTYPGLRFYDPYDIYNLNLYGNLSPVYRPLPSLQVGQPQLVPASVPRQVGPDQPVTKTGSTPPPSEPSNLNVLNYSAKDAAIPNVPPPPLPQGGLKTDKPE